MFVLNRKYALIPVKYLKNGALLSREESTIFQPEKVEDFKFVNEPILQYLENSKERKELRTALEKYCGCVEEIPVVIGDQEYKTCDSFFQVMPHNHKKQIAQVFLADEKLLKKAVEVATAAQLKWNSEPFDKRIKIWLKAADLMATKYRYDLNATTMLGQSKSVFQAEIDAACELIDFFRNNAFFLKEALKYQPMSSDPKTSINVMKYRGFEGFIAAISPFNFTAIGGNVSFTPALIGNAVIWKPSRTASLSNWIVFKACREAGVPPGVVNFIQAENCHYIEHIIKSRYLAGINFTGSVPTFSAIWKMVSENIDSYMNFPRMVGECGGKNFHFIHPSADVDSVVAGTIRSAFEYCGQKCSAVSRMYCCESLWPKIKEQLVEKTRKIKFGDITDFKNFSGAVIDKPSWDKIKAYIDFAKECSDLNILVGGKCEDCEGYFIEPTIIETLDCKNKLMTEEIFGPVLTIFVYKDENICDILKLVNCSTQFSLTGAIYAKDRKFLKCASEALQMAAGNLYINDKSTGSIVGQQPFGGARKSGTNDKAGGPGYVLRWGNPLIVKETFVPQPDIEYPYMKSST